MNAPARARSNPVGIWQRCSALRETRVIRLSCHNAEETMLICSAVSIQYRSVTDGRTDRIATSISRCCGRDLDISPVRLVSLDALGRDVLRRRHPLADTLEVDLHRRRGTAADRHWTCPQHVVDQRRLLDESWTFQHHFRRRRQ